MNRALSPKFMDDLQNEDGMLFPLLEWIRNDDTLLLAIRKNYINVYYRGGNILKLKQMPQNQYEASFYVGGYAKDCPDFFPVPKNPDSLINSKTDIKHWIESFPDRKQVMDFYFNKTKNAEREFQQLVVRENTLSGISNKTDYFIADIELAFSDSRFDMLAFKWLADKVIRKKGNVQLSLIEMKYGDDAFGYGDRGDDSGIVDHYEKMQKFLEKQSSELVEMAENQINQLNKLELIKHTRGIKREFIVDKDRFEIVFLFANHNPRSEILRAYP